MAYDVAVVGAGLIGSACAKYLSALGKLTYLTILKQEFYLTISPLFYHVRHNTTIALYNCLQMSNLYLLFFKISNEIKIQMLVWQQNIFINFIGSRVALIGPGAPTEDVPFSGGAWHDEGRITRIFDSSPYWQELGDF